MNFLIGAAVAVAVVALLYFASRGTGISHDRRARRRDGRYNDGGGTDIHGSGSDASADAATDGGGSFGGGGASGTWGDGGGGGGD